MAVGRSEGLFAIARYLGDPSPGAPTGAAATLSGNNDIVMSWNAVTDATTDNIYMANQSGVTKTNYLSLPGGDIHANVTSPYTHASAATGTYYLVVTAFNSIGESVESTQVAITAPVPVETQAPTTPTGLTATAVSNSQINLSWTASTDNVGVTAYKVYRGASLLTTLTGTPPTTGYSDTGLTDATTYSYTVQACDSAGNCSAQSSTAAATTLAPGQYAFSAELELGFNLIAHANSTTPSQFNINVSATPPSPGVVPTDNFVTLWTWDALQGKWYFYSPLLEASGGLPAVKSYADTHFYLHFEDYNKQIEVGVGFWVNRP